MKIAVPLFRERVSPHFGSSSTVLLVEVQRNVIREKAVLDLYIEGPLDIARHLVELSVEMLICGGIQRPFRQWLTDQGVAVVGDQKGVAEEVIMNILRSGMPQRNV